MQTIMAIIRLMRVEQWVKNVFVLLPIFFGGKLLQVDSLWRVLIVFAAFCLMSSAVYVLNDIVDAKYDRLHPYKKLRPIASGAIGIVTAAVLCVLLCVLSLVLSLCIGGLAPSGVTTVVLVYFILNVAYSLVLKKVAIIDVAVISIGFVLRVVAGGIASCVWLSQWIIVMTFLLAFLLALSKRRHDVMLFEQSGEKMRSNVSDYSLRFIDVALTISAAVVLVAYLMYTMSPEVIERTGSEYLYVSALFVMLGIMRYMHLTLVKGATMSPTKVLLGDGVIQACVVCWLALLYYLIYVS